MSRSLLIDSESLQNEIVSGSFQEQLTCMLKYIPLSEHHSVAILKPELLAGLKGYILWHCLRKFRGHLGDITLGVQRENLNTNKILIYIVAHVLPGYYANRADLFKKCIPESDNVERAIKYASLALRVARFANIIVFLQEGVYSNLLTRFLQIRPNVDSGPKNVTEEIMSRELLWSCFIELLMITLPLINFHKVKGALGSWLPISSEKDENSSKPSSAPVFNASTQCPECHELPILPHSSVAAAGCSHVFCYYCISANLEANPNGYKCPKCQLLIEKSAVRKLILGTE